MLERVTRCTAAESVASLGIVDVAEGDAGVLAMLEPVPKYESFTRPQLEHLLLNLEKENKKDMASHKRAVRANRSADYPPAPGPRVWRKTPTRFTMPAFFVNQPGAENAA